MSLLKSKKLFYLSKEPMGGITGGIYYKEGAGRNSQACEGYKSGSGDSGLHWLQPGNETAVRGRDRKAGNSSQDLIGPPCF